MSVLKRLLGQDAAKPSRDADAAYVAARATLERHDHAEKLALAENDTIQPEVLYYLAADSSSEIRQRIALNPSTPHQANKLLVHDKDDEVRSALARKIGLLLPDLEAAEQTAIRDRVIEIIEILAEDHLPRVRAILAEEIKNSARVPKPVILRLAQDIEAIVCAPILEYSPLLGDHDLKEIIAAAKIRDALPAIARRQRLSAGVADAIAASLDIPAVAALLANPSAQIREDTLDMIVEQAQAIEEWHRPLVERPNLSIRTMRRLACFVAASLVEILVEKNNLGADDARELLTEVKYRIQHEAIGVDEDQNVAKAVAALYDKGAVDEKFILTAIQEKRREAVIHGLALLSGLSADNVRKLIAERNGRKITALAWKAGLAMRTAHQLQINLAFVPAGQIVNAKGGFDYPLSPQQMAGLLETYQ